MRIPLLSLSLASLIGFTSAERREVTGRPEPSPLDSIIPNDNHRAAGVLRNGVVQLSIEARRTQWRPDPAVDSMVTVLAFAETGKAPSVPGPLVRVRQGTEVVISVRNSVLDSTLVIHGLRPGAELKDDTIQIKPGQIREVKFRAQRPGTYLYWGAASQAKMRARSGRDAQMNGIIVVDPPGGKQFANERIFVISLIDVAPDSAKGTKEDIWEIAVNGRSWPHTERLTYAVGEKVHWRFVNATDRYHPMHLHGFHFRVMAKGNGSVDTTYSPQSTRLAVTEAMLPGSTVTMEWVPTRSGNWLMHCHMIPHITPFPKRPDSVTMSPTHDPMMHAEESMAGLVLGITSVDTKHAGTPHLSSAATQRLWLYAQQRKAGDEKPIHGYVLQRGILPARDSVEIPGSTIFLTRGRTTRITVVNTLDRPTSVHWHGLEIESVYDGVAGWSGWRGMRAPLIKPGGSYSVFITPPRAGTFMYHSHMDEETQLPTGMYGPIIVLEPRTRFDPAHDRTFMYGMLFNKGKRAPALNGTVSPAPMVFQKGEKYRLRFLSILTASSAVVSLVSGTDTLTWRPVAKDGADLPKSLMQAKRAVQFMGVGEAYDFEWTPAASMDATLLFRPGRELPAIEQKIRVQ